MRRFEEAVSRAAELGTDVELGLDPAAVDTQRVRFGANRFPEIRGKSLWALFGSALNDKTLIILLGAAGLAIAVEVLRGRLDASHSPHYVDGLAILAAVLVATLVTTFNEAKAAKEFRALAKERADVPVKTLRGGHVAEVSIHDLVVGDLALLGSGDRVPADGLLLSGVDVRVDQSMLTGESMEVSKGAADLELMAGVIVNAGTGTLLVTAVGTSTEMGKLQQALVGDDSDQTPLQERLAKLADHIGLFGLGAAILTFLALSISAFARNELPMAFDLTVGAALLEFAIVAVTIVVVAVPEGLPVAVTISLAYSVRKMARDKNLVRRLASCETMGGATVICSDKTGTLTKNQMSVERLWIDGQANEDLDAVDQALRQRFAELAAINSTAHLDRDDTGGLSYVGNPTECALLAQADAWSMPYSPLRAAADVAHQIGFTSDRKRMSTLVRTDGGGRLLVKGAPDTLLERSTSLHRALGAAPLTDADRAAIDEAVTSMSAGGQRTLALAYRDLPAGADLDAAAADPEHLESELVFFGLVGIADPVRPEVEAAVKAARAAGVSVKMVTGDNKIIAETIARQLHLLGPADVSLEGPEFRAMSDAEVEKILPTLRVLARSVPTDKLRLVSLLRKQGEVVAVTGDGTNDAPALKAADVGFSMGISGTEVAKEASDIVILDDNFASIVSAIRWGRSIFANIRKFLQFQLTVNVVALVTAFGAAVLGFGIPLNTVQLLWVNLIMDTLAALALAVEPPTDALLRQPPHGRTEPLISRSMWTSIGAMSAVMIAVLFAIMWGDFLVPAGTSHQVRLTFVFNVFVWMQLFNEINARSTTFDRGVFEGLAGSHLFIGVLLTTAALQVLIIQFGGRFFRTVPLDGALWLRSVAIGASVLIVGALLRAAARQLPKAWFAPKRLGDQAAQT